MDIVYKYTNHIEQKGCGNKWNCFFKYYPL